MTRMTEPPTPNTSHGQAFSLYGDDIAIRWSRKTVKYYGHDLDEIAKKIRDAVHEDGRPFISDSTVHHGEVEVTFWANLHGGSGYYLVNAFLREAGVIFEVPARADVLKNDGWDIDHNQEAGVRLLMPARADILKNWGWDIDDDQGEETDTLQSDRLDNYTPYGPPANSLYIPNFDGTYTVIPPKADEDDS